MNYKREECGDVEWTARRW